MTKSSSQKRGQNSSSVADAIYWVRWATHKVINRDPFYVPRRLSYTIKKRWTDWTFRTYKNTRRNLFKSKVPSDPKGLLAYFRERKDPKFHFQPDEIERIILSILPNVKEKTIREAENLVQNQFTFRGIGPVELNPLDWNYSSIDAIGWRWHLNRHFFFSSLGFAYWYTKDIRFAEKFFEFSSSWIELFSRQLGKISWDHPFEVAARLNAWIWTYFLFLPCPHWKQDTHYRFLTTLGWLTEYLYRVIEYHNPGNHILLEAKALALCAGLFPEFAQSDRWEKKAWRILNRELRSQICADGVHAERSTMYHRIVAGELAEMMLFCRRNNRQVDYLRDVVCRMANFESWIAGGLRDMPLFGDAYRQDPYYRFWAPTVVAGCSNSDMPLEGPDRNEQSIWAIGVNKGLKSAHEEQSPALGMAFPDGGYFVSRWGWHPAASVLVWDCGPVGYHANPYHAHLDTLSFTLAIDGVEILIDPGTDELDLATNRSLRRTPSHNTVVVDGQDQSILAPLGQRNEIWSPARAEIHLWATSADCDVMSGSHDGYRRLPGSVRHTRTIVSMRGKYWIILDRMQGSGWHSAEQRFHSAPNTAIQRSSSGESFTLIKENTLLSFYPINSAQQEEVNAHWEICLEEGIAQLIPFKIENVQIISVKQNGRVPFDMSVILAPGETTIDGVKGQSKESDGESSSIIEVEGKTFHDYAYFRKGEKKVRGVLGEWQTDADVLILRKQDTEMTDVYAVGAETLMRGGKNLFNETRTSGLKIHRFSENHEFSKGPRT